MAPLEGGRTWNYLRVRGEYLINAFLQYVHLGTTSACAENTGLLWR